ncbi:hypothetical protein pah_c040o005 [Parachlamydia acanthamoebae str. Hall's coccus]|nr:hypothetical protein pah_c040o005 [Parachlamydia acanthamoebae str. Hall's coccus]
MQKYQKMEKNEQNIIINMQILSKKRFKHDKSVFIKILKFRIILFKSSS